MKQNARCTLFILPFFFLIFSLTANAEIKPASIFTDNMVLQQNASVELWGWAAPGNTVSVTPSWNNKKYTTKADVAGNWRISISTPSAGGPYDISLSDGKLVKLKNVLLGEVWLCSGQSNMEMPMKGFRGQPILGSNDLILKSKNKNIRLYTVPKFPVSTPQDNSKPAQWMEADPESVSNFSATAYYFGNLLQEMLGVPVGLINTSYGGTAVESWMNTNSLQSFPQMKIPEASDSIKAPARVPTVLYNGMIHPLVGYGIRGALWYQGETNHDKPDEYEQLFPAMVASWRSLWKTSFPFYYVQIAPFNYAPQPSANYNLKYNSAYLRDAQRKSLDKIPNSGMAVLMDAGEEFSIHPANKKSAGERLALLALGKTYGKKGFGFESATYDSLNISGSTAEVKFKNAENWLTSFGKELTGFEIAGKDKVFYPAKAAIVRNTVLVSSPQVREPVAVRYAFRDFVTGSLFGTEGLPVSSFRTDSW